MGMTHLDAGALDYLIEKYHLKSMIDIGCGPGGMVHMALQRGLRCVGVDGDPNVFLFTPLKEIGSIVVHDFCKGPSAILDNFDLAWSIEFLEHMDERYACNYLSLFKRARFVFCTAAPPGKFGHHHVNCQTVEYWIHTFTQAGFCFCPATTAALKSVSTMKREFVKISGMFFLNNSVQTGPFVL
jgi:cyclopropane fatty-acyl-phospholipid synthase-like methyltransferase